MKIGFQIEDLDPARGGAETYVYRFAEELLAAGHEVHLIAAAFGATPAGAYTHRVMRRGLTRSSRDVHFAFAAGRAARRAGLAGGRAGLDVVVAVGRTLGADVLQPHGGTLRGNRRQNLRLIRGPVLRELKRAFDVLNPKTRTHLWIESKQFSASPPPQVVAISRMVLRDMKEFYAVPDERLHLVYNGVDLERFSPSACDDCRADARAAYGLAPDETCFLIVAHNFRLKGVRELVDAAARLDLAPPRRDGRPGSAGPPRPDGRDPWRLIVIGKENPKPYLERAARLGCADRFLFPGAAADVVPAYAAADVYVQPTWYDPCSLVVLEALACGRPVITTRFNGAAELMEDGREGFLLDAPDQTDRLAEAMKRLLDPALRARLGAAARLAVEPYSIQRNFREMMAVLERAAALKENAP
ncbi:MAG TPA: glycosyltransferase family 4 protein [Phycisphaerae bacterium]|nr:glycosyltransferase family 4 protein [Phycisphaerae bacterium]